jgi:hypothetical protein
MNQMDDGGNLANVDAPMMLGTADLAFLIEFQKDSEPILMVQPFYKKNMLKK